MAEQQRGRERREIILAALAGLYDHFGEPPTVKALAELTGVPESSIQQHAARLRAMGYVHLDSLWITRAGYEAIRPRM